MAHAERLLANKNSFNKIPSLGLRGCRALGSINRNAFKELQRAVAAIQPSFVGVWRRAELPMRDPGFLLSIFKNFCIVRLEVGGLFWRAMQ